MCAHTCWSLRSNNTYGELSERFMVTVLKTVVRQRTGGSNPSLSAMIMNRLLRTYKLLNCLTMVVLFVLFILLVLLSVYVNLVLWQDLGGGTIWDIDCRSRSIVRIGLVTSFMTPPSARCSSLIVRTPRVGDVCRILWRWVASNSPVTYIGWPEAYFEETC